MRLGLGARHAVARERNVAAHFHRGAAAQIFAALIRGRMHEQRIATLIGHTNGTCRLAVHRPRHHLQFRERAAHAIGIEQRNVALRCRKHRMQRVPAARFRRNKRIEGMSHFAFKRLERIDRLGARGHLFDEHRRRSKAHRHRNASIIRQFIEREQRNRAIVGHALLRNENAHIRVATAARRHNGRAHRDVFNFLLAQISHGAFLSLQCTVVLKYFDKE